MFAKGLKQLLAGMTALCLLAGPALSEVHNILIMDFAYFPTVTYVQPGDTLTFTNESSLPHTVVSQDTSWGLGPIASGDTGSIVVLAAMQPSFYNATEIGQTSLEVAEVPDLSKEQLAQMLESKSLAFEDMSLIPSPTLDLLMSVAEMSGNLDFSPAPLE